MTFADVIKYIVIVAIILLAIELYPSLDISGVNFKVESKALQILSDYAENKNIGKLG